MHQCCTYASEVHQRCFNLLDVFRQPDGHTPLMVAAHTNQDPSVLSTLIELRSDVNATEDFGLVLSHFIKSPGQVQVLAQAKADITSGGPVGSGPLVTVSAWSSCETVAAMIACRCEVNVQEEFFSPLHTVSTTSKQHAAEKAQLLIGLRADLDKRASLSGSVFKAANT